MASPQEPTPQVETVSRAPPGSHGWKRCMRFVDYALKHCAWHLRASKPRVLTSTSSISCSTPRASPASEDRSPGMSDATDTCDLRGYIRWRPPRRCL
jgi:hypothetical protein